MNYLGEWIKENAKAIENSEYADILDSQNPDVSEVFIEQYLIPLITSNVYYDFGCEIDADKLIKNEPPKVTVPSFPCVVVSHSFDVQTDVYEFDTDEEASQAVKDLFTAYMNEELENHSDIVESECVYSEDEGYAQIVWSDGDRTTFTATYSQKYV